MTRNTCLAILLLALPVLGGCRKGPPYAGKSVAQLRAMLKDPSPSVQVQGAFGLGQLGPEAREAVADLTQALAGPEALVRQQAAGARRRVAAAG